MSLDKNIARARRAKKLRPSQLAKLMGVSRSTVHAWENGGPGPPINRLRDVAAELDTTVAALLGEVTP